MSEDLKPNPEKEVTDIEQLFKLIGNIFDTFF